MNLDYTATVKKIYFIKSKNISIYQQKLWLPWQEYTPCELGSNLYYKLSFLPILFYKEHIPFDQIDWVYGDWNSITITSFECPTLLDKKVIKI